MKFISWILNFFRFSRRKKIYRLEYLEEIPDHLASKTLYVLGERDDPWSASLLCPCNCGEKIQLSLLSNESPSWNLVENGTNGKVSLMPSVWRQKGCKSHFFFTNNEITWCD
ncbi:hypothetical protein IM538_18555 [Cytobacillus suaedae]|nr:hypothetical protein IM538_18555 [Cytobacillus suaedae]